MTIRGKAVSIHTMHLKNGHYEPVKKQHVKCTQHTRRKTIRTRGSRTHRTR